ncbi:hypothetical protein P171DRAFT_136367 [Karstenula rhodostoma CBS 690.94]|uniref:Uncharacterized protein n=1 Tax=Karstenula rhodostoma CBS 690.94 TaxID=1392251 RepID=A0A9P4UI39_9PLEO|nr:hypothetical protein P171DRAFT_136367 [Karstenula rhodostoma CBS 690.94]
MCLLSVTRQCCVYMCVHNVVGGPLLQDPRVPARTLFPNADTSIPFIFTVIFLGWEGAASVGANAACLLRLHSHFLFSLLLLLTAPQLQTSLFLLHSLIRNQPISIAIPST